MQEKETMTAAEAARILGCSPQKVREHIRRGVWTFGRCIPKKITGQTKDSFIIYRRKLYREIGRIGSDAEQ